MKKPATMIVVGAVAVGLLAITLSAARRANRTETPCAAGFTRKGPRCLGPDPVSRIVDVPAGEVTIGPSDWEAEGRVASRVVKTAAFRIDAYEVSEGGRARSNVSLVEARAF